MDLSPFHTYLSQYPTVQEAYASLSCDTEKQDFINGILHHADTRDIIITGKTLRIRHACIADAAFIAATELDPDNARWVNHWPLAFRIQQFGSGDVLQTIIELHDGTPIGFVIFRELRTKTQQVELKRIALMAKGNGYGKEALSLIQDFAFNILQTPRLYLTTRTENIRAQGIYKATGFTPETPDPCVKFHIDNPNFSK